MEIYCRQVTPRMLYMADWLGNYLFGYALPVKTASYEIDTEIPVLNYSDEKLPFQAYQVAPSGLLFEQTVQDQCIEVDKNQSLPIFFATGGQHGFDILSAVFYLIARYEEYLPAPKDIYGRYAHINSIAFRNNFLKRPVVDEWMVDLKENLRQFYPGITFKTRAFTYQPTYDIDIAWSYLNKSNLVNAAGFVKDLFKGNILAIKERMLTLSGRTTDPFDVFKEWDVIHDKYNLSPVYFFLMAAKRAGYDKNISPVNKPFQSLIREVSAKYKTGIHLSWQASGKSGKMQHEKKSLEIIIDKAVKANRMHYINFHLPQTFQQLEEIEISEEYSMGYGSINGFRASTCTPYKWYDLSIESATGLTIYPFAYMEANSIFEQKEDAATALKELQYFCDITRKVNGTLVTIFHNHLVGINKEGRIWWKMYQDFLGSNF
ncbi:MAG: hypothetical protein V4717_01395 [Bacteroidota bacterium]